MVEHLPSKLKATGGCLLEEGGLSAKGHQELSEVIYTLLYLE
jgi:hypothetical protein